MNIGENLVGSALQSLGYFTIQGLMVGVREADFLAIRMNGKKIEFWHIEVQISHNPVGVLRPHAKFGNTKNNPLEAAKGFVDKKFFQKDLCQKIESVFGTKNYKRMFIHGLLNNHDQLTVFKEKKIECIPLATLIEKAKKSDTRTGSFKSFYGIASQIKF